MKKLKDYEIGQETKMIKVGMFSNAINAGLLEAGAKSGLDMTLGGAAIGGGAGAINGAFSDYEGVFSGATKGAIVGGLTGTGAKFAGSTYAKGYERAAGDMISDVADKDGKFAVSNFGFNTRHFTSMGEDESWYSDTFTKGLGQMRTRREDLLN